MSLIEIKMEIAPASVVLADEVLLEASAVNWSVLEDVVGRRAWILGIFPAKAEGEAEWRGLEPALAKAGVVVSSQPETRELADADWKESYKEHFKAWHFGALHWVPVWKRDSFRLPAGESVLWLDPGMAFGTGNHETTRLCCERLVKFAAAHGSSGQVIDAGCGSGILALSAVALGFRAVRAFDNDPVAVDVSRENAALNGLERLVDFFVGDLESGLSGRRADLVLANIQADVLMRFADRLCAAVAPGGQLVLSGILARELPQVREVFAAARPSARLDSRVMDEWSDLVLSPPA